MPEPLLPQLQSAVALLATDVEQASVRLRSLYSEHLRYENPIQRVEGVDAFLRLLRHMTTRWAPFSMQIDEGLESAERIVGRFRLVFRPTFLRRTLDIEGLTRCVISDGQIIEQRDYYDVMSSAVDAVPLAGPVYRKIVAQFTIG
jgi:limonene-1,2-epoxide hydrolase